MRYVTRIAEPADQRMGIVAFVLYLHDPKPSGLMAREYAMSLDYITIAEVVSVDDAKHRVQLKPLTLPQRIMGEKDEPNKIQYYYGHYAGLGACFVYAFTDPTKSYVVQSGGARRGDTTTSFSTGPYRSFKALPIQSEPGKIKFLGVHRVSVVIKREGILSDDKGVRIEPDNGTLLRLSDAEMNKQVFGFEARTDTGAEISFLREFIKLQRKGYWHDQAEARLKQLAP